MGFSLILLRSSLLILRFQDSVDMDSSSKTTAGRKSGATIERKDSIHVSRFNRNHTLADFTAACKFRAVIVERKFDATLLGSLDFRFLNNLKAWNWWSLITICQDVFVNEVRMFYLFGDNKDYDVAGNEKKGEDFDAEFSTKVLGT